MWITHTHVRQGHDPIPVHTAVHSCLSHILTGAYHTRTCSLCLPPPHPMVEGNWLSGEGQVAPALLWVERAGSPAVTAAIRDR